MLKLLIVAKIEHFKITEFVDVESKWGSHKMVKSSTYCCMLSNSKEIKRARVILLVVHMAANCLI